MQMGSLGCADKSHVLHVMCLGHKFVYLLLIFKANVQHGVIKFLDGRNAELTGLWAVTIHIISEE